MSYSAPLKVLARPAGLEPATAGLAYHYSFRCRRRAGVCWSGLSLHRLRCRTYSLYGSPRCRRFPRDCHQHYLLRVPRYSAVHSGSSCSRQRLLLLKGRCSIRLSYGRISRFHSLPGLAGPVSPCLTSQGWSGQTDSNRRPSAPKADALPDCAMPRFPVAANYSGLEPARRGILGPGWPSVNPGLLAGWLLWYVAPSFHREPWDLPP